MSNALMIVSLSRAIWRGTDNCFRAIRPISCTKGMVLNSGEIMTTIMSSGADILNQKLTSASSPSTVLKIVHEHQNIMNSNHTLQALNSIFALQKEGKTSLTTKQLIQHPDFEALCRNLKKNSGVMDVKDAIQALKIVSYTGVPSTSTISQVLLQIIRQNINFLNLQQVIFLDFIIHKLSSTPLIDALKIALPLVFEIHLPKKMDRQKPEHMADCLDYALKANVSQDTVDLIVESLENYQGEIDGNTAKRIIWLVCSVNRDARYEAIINKSAANLVINLDNLSVKDMEVCLNKLAHQYTQTYKFYYQEVLFDTCGNYIVDHQITFKRATGVLRNMARVHHFHKPLLDYVSAIIHENPSIERDASDIYSIVISLILTDYKPIYWDSLKIWIKSTKDLVSENRKEILWIRFAAALCLLDIYKIDVLSRALQKSYISHLLLNKGFWTDFENYFTIWHSITIYKPDLIDLLPSNLDPKNLVFKWKHSDDRPLEAALQRGLGGEQFLLTNVYSKLGAFIDHVIVFRKGGFAVPLEKGVKFIEDLELNGDYQLVVVLVLRDYHYTANTKTLRARVTRLINIFEQNFNYHVIPIDLTSWQELNDFEKIPYLMQKLKTKLDLDINVSESIA